MRTGKLERLLAELPRDLRPVRELWPGIERSIRRAKGREARLGLELRRKWLVPSLAAAAAIALAAGALALALTRPREDQGETLLAQVEDAERRYGDAKGELLQSLRELASVYGASVERGIAEQVAAADREIAAARAAAPGADGQELAYWLASWYRYQADAMEQASLLVRAVAFGKE